MKKVRVKAPKQRIECCIDLPASKSISNRALVLQAFYPNSSISNLSTADDTLLMQEALKCKSGNIRIKNAGTCMRFLTAYFASQEGKKVNLLCDERMKLRPIKTLVDALRQLGADITYIEKEGFPPLSIQGKKLIGKPIRLDASESSQYITALMLIAPQIENGLEIILEGEIASKDYIDMTAKLMCEFGLNVCFENNIISIPNQSIRQIVNQQISIEPDWSSAAFWYQIAALSQDASITLNKLSIDTMQGDNIIAQLLSDIVETKSLVNEIIISSIFNSQHSAFNIHLQNQPDLVPALVVTLAALGFEAKLTGLQNLKIKESNRLQSLHDELNKLGFNIKMDEENLEIRNTEKANPSTPLRVTELVTQSFDIQHINTSAHQYIKTYNDHRMAMAFAPLALVFGEVIIENPDVVEKSYPHYWDDLKKAGFGLEFFEV